LGQQLDRVSVSDVLDDPRALVHSHVVGVANLDALPGRGQALPVGQRLRSRVGFADRRAGRRAIAVRNQPFDLDAAPTLAYSLRRSERINDLVDTAS
jgi:hypothetical protein